jgi:Icc-related predicted phosphoesterase
MLGVKVMIKFKPFGYNWLAVALFVIGLSGCSHTKPYVHEEDTTSNQLQVELSTIQQRVILIGDAGKPVDCESKRGMDAGKPMNLDLKCEDKICEPVLKLMTWWAYQIPERTFSVFLGDNVYPEGVTSGAGDQCSKDDDVNTSNTKLDDAKKYLQAQVDVLKCSGTKGVFVPGNHDWGGASGPFYEVLENQFEMLQNQKIENIHKLKFTPGCPGPEKIDLDGVRIVVMDSQWWLTKRRRPGTCSGYFAEKLGEELRSMLASGKNPNNTIVVTHHPLATHGQHGGFYDWKVHVFPFTDWKNFLYIPLPVAGSLYVPIRKYLVKSPQDLVGDKNRNMRTQWAEAYKNQAPFIHAAGHDHSLQVLTGGTNNYNMPKYLLVSGAESEEKLTRVGHGNDTLFAHEHTGFMVVDFFDDTTDMKPGSVLLQVVEPDTESDYGKVVYSKWLRGGFKTENPK